MQTDLENFLGRVQKMRQKQREYEKRKNDVTKRHAAELEKEVDQLVIQLIKKGYNPLNDQTQQIPIL